MKKSVIFMALLAVAALLAGCAGSNGEASVSPSDASASDASAEVSVQVSQEVSQEVSEEPEAWSVGGIRKLLREQNKMLGVILLPGSESYEDCMNKIKADEKLKIFAEIPEERYVSASDGTETFLLIPASESAGVKVQTNSVNMESGENILGEMLYQGEGQPVIVKCNFSSLFPDSGITVECDGETVAYFPQTSLKDGQVSVVGVEEHVAKVMDYFTES